MQPGTWLGFARRLDHDRELILGNSRASVLVVMPFGTFTIRFCLPGQDAGGSWCIACNGFLAAEALGNADRAAREWLRHAQRSWVIRSSRYSTPHSRRRQRLPSQGQTSRSRNEKHGDQASRILSSGAVVVRQGRLQQATNGGGRTNFTRGE